MSASHYERCCEYKGRPVVITTTDGRAHRGIVERVDRRHVYLRPTGGGRGGLGYSPWWAYGYGGGGFYRPGYGYAVALGAIAGVALATAFFW